MADTVAVSEGGPPEVLTRFSGASWKNVSYDIREEDDAGGSDMDDLDDLHGSQPRGSAGSLSPVYLHCPVQFSASF